MSGKHPATTAVTKTGRPKRQCTLRQKCPERHLYATDNTIPSSALEALPSDTRVKIMDCLCEFDLNCRYALLSRQCVDDSRSGAAKMSKRGTLRLNGRDSLNDCMLKICSPAVKKAFSGPRETMQIDLTCDEMAQFVPCSKDTMQIVDSSSFPDVKKLILVLRGAKFAIGFHSFTSCISKLVPNLEKLYLKDGDSYYTFTSSTLRSFSKCKKINCIRTIFAGRVFDCDLKAIKSWHNLDTLILIGATLECQGSGTAYGDEGNDDIFLAHACQAKFVEVDLRWTNLRGGRAGSIPQAWLMKFVRRTPTLMRFASDLTDANIEILRKERPDITFANTSDIDWAIGCRRSRRGRG